MSVSAETSVVLKALYRSHHLTLLYVCFRFYLDHIAVTVILFFCLRFCWLLIRFHCLPFKFHTFMWPTWRMSDIISAHLITTIIAHKGNAKKKLIYKIKNSNLYNIAPRTHALFILWNCFLTFLLILAPARKCMCRLHHKYKNCN